jgi:AcrR family transcriptional regulator
MSPYPTRIVREELIERAGQLLESEGIEGLTLNRLASEFHVKAASLYNHFENKAALLRAVSERTVRGLVAAMRETAIQNEATPAVRLHAMADSYRQYALGHPVAYELAYGTSRPDMRLPPELAEALALPLQAAMAELAGADRALDALRGAWALIHGFVMLELGGQFRRGGNLDSAFAAAIDLYLRGLYYTEA